MQLYLKLTLVKSSCSPLIIMLYIYQGPTCIPKHDYEIREISIAEILKIDYLQTDLPFILLLNSIGMVQ